MYCRVRAKSVRSIGRVEEMPKRTARKAKANKIKGKERERKRKKVRDKECWRSE